MEKTIYIYNTKNIKYETTSYDESNDVFLALYM